MAKSKTPKKNKTSRVRGPEGTMTVEGKIIPKVSCHAEKSNAEAKKKSLKAAGAKTVRIKEVGDKYCVFAA
jgi:hypothetical protein